MLMTGQVMAAKEVGPGACIPEAGDNRETGDKSEITPDGFIITQTANSHVGPTWMLFPGSVEPTEFDYTPPNPNDPKLLHIAVMGNDATAGTVVLGAQRLIRT